MFLLGNWKNYDELEENLSVEELVFTLNAYRKQSQEERKFLAALQGVDLSEQDPVNITDPMHDTFSEGFGVGAGLGHSVQSVGAS